jgi:hypothetical protein
MNVYLVYGYNSYSLSFALLRWFLSLFNLQCAVLHYTYCDDLDVMAREIETQIDPTTPAVLVGQSLGGCIANRVTLDNVVRSVCIASPLRGCRVAATLNHRLNYLNDPNVTEWVPKFPVHTISFGWAWTSFDGRVFADEATFDTDTHVHIPWTDHVLAFASPLTMRTVAAHIAPLCV